MIIFILIIINHFADRRSERHREWPTQTNLWEGRPSSRCVDFISYTMIIFHICPYISFMFDPIFHICNTMPQVGWDRTGWEAFKYMLFDPDNGTILTRCNLKYKYKGRSKYKSKLKFTNLFCRTPLSWLKITVFYIIYYTLLACFWIACLVIFFQVCL